MEYFFYCRDKPNTAAVREQVNEAHQSFMDRYTPGMIARGPTLNDEGTLATGSMHIVDLPHEEAAHSFAFDEPYYLAGIFAEVRLYRWRNELGKTMWEFEGDPSRHQRFLIIAHANEEFVTQVDALPARQSFLDQYRNQLIASGPLFSPDGAVWLGSAMLAEAPDRAAIATLVEADPYAQAGLYQSVMISRWRFGGR